MHCNCQKGFLRLNQLELNHMSPRPQKILIAALTSLLM